MRTHVCVKFTGMRCLWVKVLEEMSQQACNLLRLHFCRWNRSLRLWLKDREKYLQ